MIEYIKITSLIAQKATRNGLIESISDDRIDHRMMKVFNDLIIAKIGMIFIQYFYITTQTSMSNL